MERWRKSLAESISSLKELAERFPINIEPLQPAVERNPMRITPYYLSLIQEIRDPIWRQCVPDHRELEESFLSSDPLNESKLSPVPGLIHRYPDRVVLLVSSTCATFCRFCTRKFWIRSQGVFNVEEVVETALEYIRNTSVIRDVILSGGDPLLLSDEFLESILIRLRKIPHVEIIRIGTRTPVTLPDRITFRLCKMLKRYHPLYLNTHFNHPSEITAQSTEACSRLTNSGIPLGNQTVLLKGVNDDPTVMKRLMQRLLVIRVRPYYLHQMDLVKGTNHFRTSIEEGSKIIAGLRGFTSGMAIPSYMIDLPDGKGKVQILPDNTTRKGKTLYFRNYLGETVAYPDDKPQD